jgi:pilus assembly protein CpaF
MREDGISEVMINARDMIYVEKGGKLMRVRNLEFESDEQVIAAARQILAPLGKDVNAATPLADGRMSDGSRVNVIIPPLATRGPSITIRRFSTKRYTGEDLVRFGSLSPNMLKFLQLCVRERISLVVSGGTGSGKTTLLNVLSSFIPNSERIVTIEDAAELRLDQEHVVSLEARSGLLEEGQKPIEIRELVKNSLRMRPDRIVVGECRGGEALDMLQAMNTGHEGSMTTVHSNSPRDALSRLETLVMMAGYDLPISAIRHQVTSAVALIVQQSRFRDGSRKITSICEVTGIQNDTILMAELFVYKHEGYARDGAAIGRFACSGFVPKVAHQMRANGVAIDLEMFAQAGVDKTV